MARVVDILGYPGSVAGLFHLLDLDCKGFLLPRDFAHLVAWLERDPKGGATHSPRPASFTLAPFVVAFYAGVSYEGVSQMGVSSKGV